MINRGICIDANRTPRSVRPRRKAAVLLHAECKGSNESRGIAIWQSWILTKYGITGTTEIVYNPSYEHAVRGRDQAWLEGYEKGQVSELGAVNVMTGVYTGRSPKDKFIVMDENSKDTVWWTSDEYKNDNHPLLRKHWAAVKDIARRSCPTSACMWWMLSAVPTRIPAWLSASSMEVAWQAHFVTNMFIKPTAEELENFEPDFVVYNASKAKVENYKELGLNI